MDATAPMKAQPETIPLWPEGAPGSEDWQQQEEESLWPPSLKVVRNVAQPTLTAYLPTPSAALGASVVVCPGGAFHFLSIDLEGTDVARWLNLRGVAAFVLKYRLIRTGDDFPAEVQRRMQDRSEMEELRKPLEPLLLADGQQALRIVRQRAAGWGLAPDRIGIMGFSAGGVVASRVALRYEPDSRPAFVAVIYGAPGQPAQVPPDAPPLFVLCAGDDAMAAPRSLQLYADWRAAGHPAELHIYAKGGHGFGLRTQGLPSDHWIDRFADWLQAGGLLDPRAERR